MSMNIIKNADDFWNDVSITTNYSNKKQYDNSMCNMHNRRKSLDVKANKYSNMYMK